MKYEKTKRDWEILNKDDAEFIKSHEGWHRTRSEHLYIDCNELSKKKKLTPHQKYEKRVCEMARRKEKSEDPFRGCLYDGGEK